MHPILQLQNLLDPNKKLTGSVVSTTTTTMNVATSNGIKTVGRLSMDGTQYKVGDVVTVKDGIVLGKRIGNQSVYVV